MTKQIMEFIGIGIVTLFWLYIAARMITRGVIRSIDEKKKEREKNG